MAKVKVEPMTRIKILAIVSWIIFIGCFASSRPSKPISSDPDGFRGIKWGTEISALNDMEKVEEGQSSNKDLVWYARREDTLAIGAARFKNVFYSFWMGKFESVWIDFEGDENFEAVRKELIERFGKVREPEGPVRKMERGARAESSAMKPVEGFYAWWGRNTDVVLSYSKDRHKGTLTFYSTMISEERRAYEKEKKLKERGF
ncbi:MAG TPA: hypothetical protein VK551_10930 [Thermodesulfobacteriota bacterium]|nr:hypothetical protein [Thermodesulfobacteriota bacterium]